MRGLSDAQAVVFADLSTLLCCSPRKSFSGQRMVSARQPVNHVQPSAAILDNPVNGTRLSVAKEEGTNDVDLVWETGMSFPDTSSRDYPGFSSYDEAEETRSRLPVQNLDLVPTIFSRSGTPIMLKAKFWLDPMMTYQPGMLLASGPRAARALQGDAKKPGFGDFAYHISPLAAVRWKKVASLDASAEQNDCL